MSGKYRGRIFVAASHSTGDPKPDFTDYYVHGFYTDAHGKLFKLSENISFPDGNESTATEISGGRVMLMPGIKKATFEQELWQ